MDTQNVNGEKHMWIVVILIMCVCLYCSLTSVDEVSVFFAGLAPTVGIIYLIIKNRNK